MSNNIQRSDYSLYDFTICTLACTKQKKYADRLKDYIDFYGFRFNNKSLKIKFVFLVEDESRPDFLHKEHIWYNCPGLPMSMRWAKYLKDEHVDSKWIMQVDDDSSTDIDKTVEILNQYYDHQDSMLLMGGRNTDLELGQQNILKSMKIENIFFESNDISKFEGIPYFVHAWEPSIISYSGMHKMKKWDRLNEYFSLCKNIRPTFGDQTPYVIAKLSKIPIVEASFLCPFNWANMYSAINKQGRYSHIHYVTDKWNFFTNFKIAMKNNLTFENEKETKKYLSNHIKSNAILDKNIRSIRDEQKHILDKDVKLKLTNKINSKNVMIVNIMRNGSIVVDNKDMIWQHNGKDRLSIFNKKTKIKVGEILKNAHTKEYFATLDMNGKTSATAWVGKEV